MRAQGRGVFIDPIIAQFAAATGFMAAAIAVGDFVARARPAMVGESERKLRRLTAAGGAFGLAVVVLVTILGTFPVMFCLRRTVGMTEFRAIALTMAAGLIAVAISFSALTAIHANGTVMALVFVVILAIGADTCSRVGMRYSDKRPRRSR
jgi:uncharacterized membrane protein